MTCYKHVFPLGIITCQLFTIHHSQTMITSISTDQKGQLFSELSKANTAFNEKYPGDRPERQAVHTVYGGANLFKYNTTAGLAEKALEALHQYAPDFVRLGKIFQLQGSEKLDTLEQTAEQLKADYESLTPEQQRRHPAHLSYQIYYKVLNKLQTEAVEDFRIDFEDGYGNRSNEEEDQTARDAAIECAKGMDRRTLPPFIGIRIKPFSEEMKERGLRTLDIFVSTLVEATKGRLPDNFIVMLPKVTIPEQVSTLVAIFEILESELGLKPGALKMEMMVETTQSIMDYEGSNPLMRFIRAGKEIGRAHV